MRMMTIAAAATTGATTTSTTTTSALQPPRFVYKLGNSLYVPLTSRCNSLTLPQVRGEAFSLPTSVVATLLRVREAELQMATNEDGPKWYLKDSCGEDLPPKMKLPPPPFEMIATLPPFGSGGREPRLDSLLYEIENECRDTNQSIDSIVISGEGEPTLRLEDTIELACRIKSFTNTLQTKQSKPSIRLTTNGLVPSSFGLPQKLWDSGVSSISVGLMTWNASQYNDLVKPLQGTEGFETVCNFIQDAASINGDLEIETTAVDRPDVDKAKTEALAASLGVTNPVRWRPYFP